MGGRIAGAAASIHSDLTDRGPRTFRSRVAAPLVFAAILGLAGALALVSQKVTDRQEHQLLTERGKEVASLLTVSTQEIRSELMVAGTATTIPGAQELFKSVTAARILTGATVNVAQRQGAGFTVLASTVAGPHRQPPPDLAAVLDRARTASGMVSGLVTRATKTHLILALAVPGRTTRVAYLDTPLSPATPAPTDPNSPYRELNVAVYAGTTISPGQLVLLSGGNPGSGSNAVRSKFLVGADPWLLVVSARTSLLGSLATAFPWLLTGAGGVTALFVGLLIETLIRRRLYAVRLVEERTRSLREAQHAAERANKAKSEFLSRMSHELRTPLNAVLGFAQLLELDPLTPDQADNVQQIIRGGSHLLNLINEILDISQIESGRMSLSPEPVLVSEVVAAAAALVRPLAEDRSVHLIIDSGQDHDRFVFADRQRLKQILLNLLGNGIKYNRHGGSVSISCFEDRPGYLRIQVTDTGPGIAPENFDLLFAPFERLGAEQTTIEGTGVGLALSRGLAEAMGGQLDVESSPGRGSTFWIEFPIVEGPDDSQDRATAETTESGEEQLVLHIEDNPANLALVERVLAQRPNVRLLGATQGRVGLDLARQHRPALILLDLNLADLPGAEVLAELRTDLRTADIPVVVISADAMPRQIQRLMNGGAAAYLTKPIDIRELLAQIDAMVGAPRGNDG